MAMAIALANRTRPASCPPMRRELSGNVADTVVASDWFGSFVAWLADAAALVLDPGETVGNSPEGSVGEVNAPLGNGGNEVPGGSGTPGSVPPGTAGGGEVEVLDATTPIVALAWNEVAPLALAVAVIILLASDDPLDGGVTLKPGQSLIGHAEAGRKPAVTNSKADRNGGNGVVLADDCKVLDVRIERTRASGVLGFNVTWACLLGVDVASGPAIQIPLLPPPSV